MEMTLFRRCEVLIINCLFVLKDQVKKAQQLTTLPNSSLKFFKITVVRLHPILKIVQI